MNQLDLHIIGNSADKLRHTRSVAYSVELVVLNKHQLTSTCNLVMITVIHIVAELTCTQHLLSIIYNESRRRIQMLELLHWCMDTSDLRHFGPKTFQTKYILALCVWCRCVSHFCVGAEVSNRSFGTSAEVSRTVWH